MKRIIFIISLLSIIATNAQIVDVPDVNFKYTLLTYSPSIDINSDGEIQNTEAESVLSLDLYMKNINDLTGIEAFINLTSLSCADNHLESLDLSSNPALTLLDCSMNDIISLNLINNNLLTEIDCGGNDLIDLNINNNTALTKLTCFFNSLTALDVSLNSELTQIKCGHNNLSELDVSSNTLLTELSCDSNLDLSELILTNNTNLVYLFIFNTAISNVDLSTNILLEHFDCSNTELSNLDVSHNTALAYLSCASNSLSNIDLTNNTALLEFNCQENSLISLNLSNNSELTTLHCESNIDLLDINLKNGNNSYLELDPEGITWCSFTNLPNLSYVCVDDIDNTILTDYINAHVLHSVTYTEYCSLTPALSNQIIGTTNIDLTGESCESSDIPVSNILIQTDNTIESFSTFSQEDGSYALYTNDGDFITIASTNLPSYFTINPESFNSIFDGFNNTDVVDFCVVPTEAINDVNISVIPLGTPNPGFETTYRLVYNNIGTTVLNGNIIFDYIDTSQSFISANETVSTETSSSVTFTYENLNPFETRTIDIVLSTFPSPTVEIGDSLYYTATITPIEDDYTEADNVFTFSQIVIGSYDPNDIHVLEGSHIRYSACTDYLHYVIRFQNEGTAEAVNIVVTNKLDANLDWNTIQLQNTGHTCRVNIKNGNDVDFIFEDINLPDSTTDEENSHGFIAYKIKPKTGINIGDVIPNQANIFFDFNEAVETNTIITDVIENIGINDENHIQFSLYPNPTKGVLNISTTKIITTIKIYNKLGQIVLMNNDKKSIDISKLNTGIYFCKITDNQGGFGVNKIIKL